MSWLSFVWIFRHFCGDICFLFTCTFKSFKVTIFPRNINMNVILVALFWIISPRLRHSEQVYFTVSGLLFCFPKKLTQGPTRSCRWDVCGRYFWHLFGYFWHLQCLWNCRLWLSVFAVLSLDKDCRYGF